MCYGIPVENKGDRGHYDHSDTQHNHDDGVNCRAYSNKDKKEAPLQFQADASDTQRTKDKHGPSIQVP